MITLFALLFPGFNYNNWETVWSVSFVRLNNASCLEWKHSEDMWAKLHLDEECSQSGIFPPNVSCRQSFYIGNCYLKKKIIIKTSVNDANEKVSEI